MSRRKKKPEVAPTALDPRKRKLLAALLLALALWPFAQRALVARFDVNPWKLAGFAMYATPAPPLLVAVLVPEGDAFTPLAAHTLEAEARAALEQFQMRRHAVGALVEPSALAAQVFADQSPFPAPEAAHEDLYA